MQKQSIMNIKNAFRNSEFWANLWEIDSVVFWSIL
jgi:hypothetical protein